MNIKPFAIAFMIVFAVVLVAGVVAISLFGLAIHGSVDLNWEIGFTVAISLAIVVPWVRWREKKKSAKQRADREGNLAS
ncbi:MAG: hypothetical protein WB699_13660 [Bacteroidota bacterium]